MSLTLTDSSGDGWNGNVLALRQNGVILGTFGGSFTAGNSNGPIFIPVPGNALTQVAVSQLGNKSQEVGFILRNPSGVIFQRAAGTTFDAYTVFTTFCPTGICPTTTSLLVQMTDTSGDGWNGNVFGFKQNNAVVGTFGSNFTTGNSSGLLYITVAGSLLTQIVVIQTGIKPN